VRTPEESRVRTPPLVLIADDNPMNLKILATRLVAEGYQIVTAPDGAEALAARAAQRPDLILLDVMMPKIDGVEVCRRLKEDPTAAFTPIILDAGADEYLTKPVSHQALIARVRSMLRIKGLHDTVHAQAQTLALKGLRKPVPVRNVLRV
jgi:adenylate cyclase